MEVQCVSSVAARSVRRLMKSESIVIAHAVALQTTMKKIVFKKGAASAKDLLQTVGVTVIPKEKDLGSLEKEERAPARTHSCLLVTEVLLVIQTSLLVSSSMTRKIRQHSSSTELLLSQQSNRIYIIERLSNQGDIYSLVLVTEVLLVIQTSVLVSSVSRRQS